MYSTLWRIPIVISVTLTGLVFSSSVMAQEGNFTAKVFPLEGKPMLIEDVSLEGKYYFSATWGSSSVKLPFRSIKTVNMFVPTGNKAEIIFHDGRKDIFYLQNPFWLHGKFKYGNWKMFILSASKIEFTPSTTSQTKLQTVSSEFDRIFFKDGDVISGQVQTDAFKLRASYGNLSFETAEISYIEFESGGQSIDIVVLKNGDRLSGIVEEPIVTVLQTSGTRMDLDKEDIKKITFKK
jgi:hypothetical protein